MMKRLNKMKIFKINDPYFALIAAHDVFEVTDTYKKIVSDVEDEEYFIAELKVIDNQEAAERTAKSISEETGKPIGITEGMQEVMNAINSDEPYLLLMDSSLV